MKKQKTTSREVVFLVRSMAGRSYGKRLQKCNWSLLDARGKISKNACPRGDIARGGAPMSYLYTKAEVEDIMENSYDRPIGVSLLSFLLTVQGVVALIGLMMVIRNSDGITNFLGISGWLLQGAIGLIGGLGLAAGVGMWLGKKWGWWLALFYFAYSVSRNINVLLSISSITEAFGASGQASGANYVKYALRALWNAFLMFYLCRDAAASYFGNESTIKWKAVLIVFGVSLLVFIVGTLLN
jgi:hypothetical protein